MPGQQVIHHTQASNFTQVVFKGVEPVAPIPSAGNCCLITKITSGGLFSIDNFNAWHNEIYNLDVMTDIGDIEIVGVGKMLNPTLWSQFSSPVMAWSMLSQNLAFQGIPNCKVMSDSNLQFSCRVTNNGVPPITIMIYWWLLVGVMASQKIIVDTSLT